jgi:hypothetical protein
MHLCGGLAADAVAVLMRMLLLIESRLFVCRLPLPLPLPLPLLLPFPHIKISFASC